MKIIESIPADAIEDALKTVNKYGLQGQVLDTWSWEPDSDDPRGQWLFSFKSEQP